MFLVAANTRQALVGQKEWITTGSSGIQVQFLFSADWDGLAKFAVFRNAEIEESVIPIALATSGLTELPAENCAAEYVDEKVYVGVYGTDGLGHIIIPTIWVSLGVLKEGAAYEGMDPPQPTQDMWAQILAIAQNAGAENAAAAEQSAEEAEASKEAIQDMNVQAETLPDESPLTVTKEVDPETGAVTLVFGLTRGPKGTKGDDGCSPTITITPIQGGHRFTVTDEDHPTGQSFDVMNGAPGAPGSPGQDGYSPAITITTITGGHRFTVTDEDHPTGQSFDVMDGTKGDQGYSPAVTITTITGGHRVTITDEDHPTGQSFDVLDGASDAGQVTFDPTQTYQSGTVGKALSDEFRQLSDKQNAPSTDGTAGQVLGLDSNLNPAWIDQTGGGGGGAVSDVQINGTSILDGGVANVPIAGANKLGVVKKVNPLSDGINITADGTLVIYAASSSYIKTGTQIYNPIVPGRQHEAAFYGLAKAAGDSTQSASANAVGTYTEDAKSAIHEMLNGAVTVSGTTPTIVAKSGITYVCGEVATLDITPPASGIFEVQFVSGSTPTVLTATGVTWANGFDPTALEANKTYDISISNGIGVAVWI